MPRFTALFNKLYLCIILAYLFPTFSTEPFYHGFDLIILIIISFSVCHSFLTRVSVKVQICDALVISYFIYLVWKINDISKGVQLHQFIQQTGPMLLYFTFRWRPIETVDCRLIWKLSLVVLVLLLARYGLLGLFEMTNAASIQPFNNIGPFSIFLGLLLYIISAPVISGILKARVYVQLGIVILLFCIVMSLGSRTFLTAFFASIILTIKSRQTITGSLLGNRKGWSFAIIAAAILILLSMCFLNTDSITGRFVIWKISAALIYKNWIFGVGAGFPIEYSNQQFVFFSNLSNLEKYQFFAGDTFYTFNDFLRICGEQGVIGMVLFIAIISAAFLSLSKGAAETTNCDVIGRITVLRGGLIYLIVASSFSYVITTIQFSTWFWAIIGISVNITVSRNIRVREDFSSVVAKILSTFIVISLSISLFIYSSRRVQAGFAFNRLRALYYEMSDDEFCYQIKRLYPMLNFDYSYIIQLARAYESVNQYDSEVKILAEAKSILPNKDLYYRLGHVYQKLRRFDKAEKEFKYVSIKVPHLVLPRYYLVRLYKQLNDPRWITTAEAIVKQRIKVHSRLTREIKRKLETELEEYNSKN